MKRLFLFLLLLPAWSFAADDPRLAQIEQLRQAAASAEQAAAQLQATIEQESSRCPSGSAPVPPDSWPISVGRGRVLILGVEPEATDVTWTLTVHPDSEPPQHWGQSEPAAVSGGPVLVVETLDVSWCVVSVARTVGDERLHTAGYVAVTGDTPGPDPPGPDPPDPPDPDPGIGKLSVLGLYETTTGEDEDGPNPLTPQQRDIPTSRLITDYLRDHCVVDGQGPQYRFLDEDSDLSKMSGDWEANARLIRAAPGFTANAPWIHIANDKGARHVGPWPEDVEAMLELLKRFGGE